MGKYDIKYKMTQNQQKELVELQEKSKCSLRIWLGWNINISTCAVDRNENIGSMEWFLANHDFSPESLDNYLRRFTFRYHQIRLYTASAEIHPPMDFLMQNEEEKNL